MTTRSIQPTQDGVAFGEYDVHQSVPYPYHIDSEGNVLRQDFWRGDPSRLIGFQAIHPGAAAVLAGLVCGAALLALFRHRASLGGIGAVALDVQDRFGIKAGWVQMGFDAFVFAAALALMPWERVAWSALGAAVLNLVIAINHRRDRYIV